MLQVQILTSNQMPGPLRSMLSVRIASSPISCSGQSSALSPGGWISFPKPAFHNFSSLILKLFVLKPNSGTYRTISLRFLGIILKVIRLEVSVWIS